MGGGHELIRVPDLEEWSDWLQNLKLGSTSRYIYHIFGPKWFQHFLVENDGPKVKLDVKFANSLLFFVKGNQWILVNFGVDFDFGTTVLHQKVMESFRSKNMINVSTSAA